MCKDTSFIFFLVLLSLAFLVILSACDPGLSLRVQVKNPGDRIAIYANKRFLPHSTDSGKIVFQVPPEHQPKIKDTLLFYGIGTWQNKEEVMSYASQIDSILINNSGKVNVIKNNDSLFTYLWKRRKGSMKSVIEISMGD
jgi:hypothetical protein